MVSNKVFLFCVQPDTGCIKITAVICGERAANAVFRRTDTHTQQRTTPEWVAQGCHNQDTPVQHLRR